MIFCGIDITFFDHNIIVEKKMKNFNKFFGITVITLVIGLLTTGCAKKSTVLGIPANIRIDVTDRTLIVTWDAVANASGYEVITYSEGCNSGRKKINTGKNKAVVFNPESTAKDGANALKKDKSSGAVEILEKNKIQITLMPSMSDSAKPMATAVTAKVRALGGTVSGINYSDSDYSAEVNTVLGSDGMGKM